MVMNVWFRALVDSIRNYHKFRGLNNINVLSYSSGGQKSKNRTDRVKINVSEGHFFWKLQGRIHPLPFPDSRGLPSSLGLWSPSSNFTSPSASIITSPPLTLLPSSFPQKNAYAYIRCAQLIQDIPHLKLLITFAKSFFHITNIFTGYRNEDMVIFEEP